MYASCKSLIISCVSKAYYWESKKASEWIPMPLFVCFQSFGETRTCYLMRSMLRLRNLSRAAPLSIPF